MKTLLIIFSLFVFLIPSSFSLKNSFAACEVRCPFATGYIEASPHTACRGFMGFPIIDIGNSTVQSFRLERTAEQILLLKKYKDTIKSLDDPKKEDVYICVEALEKLLLSPSVEYSIYLKATKDYQAAISTLSTDNINLLNMVFSD